jgi:hypothetical protein
MIPRMNVQRLALSLVAFLIVTTCFSQNDPIENAGKPMTPLEKHINEVCKGVVDNNRTTDKLGEEDMANLPIGIARQIGNGVYVVAIDSAYWNGRGWFFTAYASVTLPGTTKPIAFRATNVGFNKGGLSSLSATKLVLAAPQAIKISDDLVLELPADGRNFIEFDCDGFKSVNLKGNFVFTGQLIVPAKDTTSHVVASFEINATDLSNIMATVNVTPFKIKGLNDVSFEVKNAVADFSDHINPPGFTFPPDYQQQFGDNQTLWRGFYLQELTITIDGFSKKDRKPITLQGRNLLIDDLGISGTVQGNNLLTLHEGSADGWPLSVNTLSVKLLHNNLTGGSLAGNIIVPFLGKDSLAYTAEMEQVQDFLNYKFSIATGADKEFTTPFSAKIKLGAGSTITIEKKNGVLTPSTLLNGTITVQNKKMESSGIKFENLVLTTRKPYIKSGNFSTVGTGQSKSVGFPVRIDSLTFKITETGAALGFGVALNFMDGDSRGFSAKTYINVMAKYEEMQPATGTEPAQTEWKYDGIKINDIILKCNTTAFTMDGRLTVFDDDPIFGDGFRGSLSFSIKKLLERGVTVNAYFGSKKTFRYWHVDAFVPTATIPLVPPLAINGFIGGASYKMKRKETFTPDFTKLSAEGAPAGGQSPGGAQFEFLPDSTAGLSFMAGVTLIAGSEKAFNSDAVLEVAFNASGGLRYGQFKGSGYFFTSLKTRGRPSSGPQKVQAPVYAELNMLYDQDNNVFHTNLKTYMNLENTVRGIGPNNMIGEAVIHVDPHDWYVFIGRPSQMLGVDIAHLAVAQGYFMAGTQLEEMPLPPPELRNIMEEREMSLVQDPNTLAMGRGFALGARFQTGFDTKDKISPFYAVFTLGAGADVMIRDFGNATCNGSTDRIGFDGWYASGQAYVFMQGKVGIKVGGHKFDFLSLGAAALLQAKLPNPTWLKGTLAGNYSVLGGLVSGKFNVKVIIGEECEIVTPGSELGEILVIADMKPDDNTTDVSVFASPQVTFNTAIDSELSMLNNQDQLNSYRIKLDEFSVTHNGQALAVTREWNGRKDALALRTAEILPPQTTLKAFAKIHWEKKLSNGTWEALKIDNQTDYETKEVNFTTGTAPDFIPEENVSYSYPVKNQYNFLTNEYGQGYVKLRIGQSYLFQSASDSVQWKYIARFQQPSGSMIETDLTYNSNQATVNFNIPDGLTKQAVYKLTFIKKPESTGDVDTNVKRDNVTVDAGDDNEVKVASNSLEGTLTQSIEKEIYGSAFRTSQFSTFNEKWASLAAPQDLFDIAIGNIAVIGKGATIQETFDDFELKGKANHHKALVQVEASPATGWMSNTIAPLLYNSYPPDPAVTISRRNTDSLGVKPLRAVQLYNIQENYILTESNISSGISMPKSGPVKLMYYLSYVSFWDFDEMRNKAASLVLSGNGPSSPAVNNLLSAVGYTDLIPGATYPVNIKYMLPGINQVTTQKQLTIQF